MRLQGPASTPRHLNALGEEKGGGVCAAGVRQGPRLASSTASDYMCLGQCWAVASEHAFKLTGVAARTCLQG